MVAAVASDDPQTAENPPQATTVDMASPPRKRCNSLCADEKSASDTPEMVRKLPIRTKSGITASVKDRTVSKAALPVSVRLACQFLSAANPAVPTRIIAKAMGMRSRTRAKSAAKPRIEASMKAPQERGFRTRTSTATQSAEPKAAV